MELRSIISPLIKWWWLLLVATLVAATSSFLLTHQQPLEYQARTTLMIGRTISDPNPTGNEFYLSQQLAGIYADIAERDPVRNATMAALGLDNLPQYIARVLPNSQLIEIVVTDTNPERAQAVSNELANQLIQQSPTSTQQEAQNRQTFVNEQLDYLEVKIEETKDDIVTKQEELAEMVSARQIADTQQTITALQNKLITLQSNYASLLASTQQGATNTISVIEPASLPLYPIGPDIAKIVALAAVIGLVLAASGAYLIEYLDDTLKTSAEVTRVLGVPILGHVAETKELRAADQVPKLLLEQPFSPLAESFRALRTNIEFAAAEESLKTMLIMSPGAKDGRTTIAINLAIAMAQAGKHVVLIDADLRRPKVHQIFGIPNQVGLSEIIQNGTKVRDIACDYHDDRLAIVPSGSLPSNPAEVLGSPKMFKLLSGLKGVADLIVLDSSPALVSDAWILASKVDWVLVVIASGHTREGAAQAMVDQFEHTGARVMGVILNRIPRSQVYSFGRAQCHSNYTGADEDVKSEKQMPNPN